MSAPHRTEVSALQCSVAWGTLSQQYSPKRLCCVSSLLPPCCSERTLINTPGSQQHLTNLANYVCGHFYMAFLIAGKRGAVNLMKGCGHQVVLASIYIHYLAVPRVPRRKHLLASRSPPPTLLSPHSHSPTLLSSLHHPHTVQLENKRKKKITLVSRCFPSNGK